MPPRNPFKKSQVVEPSTPPPVTETKEPEVVKPEQPREVTPQVAGTTNLSGSSEGAPIATYEAPAASFGQPEGVLDITFETDVKITGIDKMPQLKKDETVRFAFILFDQATKAPLIKMSHYFYDKPANAMFLAPKNKELLGKVIAKLGEPKIRFGTIIIQYETDQYGTVPDQWRFGLYAYIFSTDKFPSYRSFHKEWGLQSHDILMTCQEPKFQKMSFNLARECVFRTNKEFEAQVIQAASMAYSQYLNRFMGAPKSDQEIMQIIGMTSVVAPGFAPGGAGYINPFADKGVGPKSPAGLISPSVGENGPKGPVTSGEFSHLVKSPK